MMVGSGAQAAAFGAQLKSWRQTRRLSQLDLALSTGVSARHVSFVETGRAHPSRPMVLRLAETLDVPQRDVNGLLEAAGFAPIYRESRLDDAALAPLRHAIDHMLRGHMPFPAAVIDRLWNVVDANQAMRGLFGEVFAGEGPPNALRLALAPGPLRDMVENWPDVARATLLRLRREVAQSPRDAALRALYDEARALVGDDITLDASAPDSPVLAMRLNFGGRTLSVFSTIAEFRTAQDVTISELRIEHMFPADAETEAVFRAAG